jgi:hypothetical protein
MDLRCLDRPRPPRDNGAVGDAGFDLLPRIEACELTDEAVSALCNRFTYDHK